MYLNVGLIKHSNTYYALLGSGTNLSISPKCKEILVK